MANEIRYSLTTSADRRTAEPTLYVCVAYKGSSNGRKYFTIQGLTSPDFRYWEKKTQRFSSGTDTAKANNPLLEDVCALCDELLVNSAITSPSEFIEALKRGVAPPDVLTLGDFLRELIDDMRSGKHHLEREQFERSLFLFFVTKSVCGSCQKGKPHVRFSYEDL